MPVQLHWLFSPETGLVGGLTGNLKQHSARKVDDLPCRGGHPVWQRGYQERALRSEESVIDVARYVIANPLRTGPVIIPWGCSMVAVIFADGIRS